MTGRDDGPVVTRRINSSFYPTGHDSYRWRYDSLTTPYEPRAAVTASWNMNPCLKIHVIYKILKK